MNVALENAVQSMISWDASLVARIRSVALRGLRGMYIPAERMFGHCIRRRHGTEALEGVSRRYTAITLIGLAGESEDESRAILAGDSIECVCRRLLSDVRQVSNLGDAALTWWAATELTIGERRAARDRVVELLAVNAPVATVELSWALTAMTKDDELAPSSLREQTAARLLSAYSASSKLFRHVTGGRGPALRSHVACFADIVYPVQALALFHGATGSAGAIEAAESCARQACALMGRAGQWWWHYDARNGRVLERYPVYAVHQDAMAPMMIFDLAEQGGADFGVYARRGLDWLVRAPELGGGSLIDDEAGLIWRKVARREPRKLVRTMQAVASAIHPALGVPGLDLAFPPTAVDWECRPYHLGWLLYAFSRARLERWGLDPRGAA